MRRNAHSVLPLPALLLALFLLLSALTVVRSAAVYRKVLDRSDRLSRSTALTYITEKVRHNDTAGSVRVGKIGDCQALVIVQGDEILYDTYIYCYDGSLRELMIKRELEPTPDMGRSLLPMESLELENTDGLLKIRCTDPQGGLWERSWRSEVRRWPHEQPAFPQGADAPAGADRRGNGLRRGRRPLLPAPGPGRADLP